MLMIRRQAIMRYVPVSEMIWSLDEEKHINVFQDDLKIVLKKLEKCFKVLFDMIKEAWSVAVWIDVNLFDSSALLLILVWKENEMLRM